MICICEVEYSRVNITYENGKKTDIRYLMTIDCIDSIYIAAEVYGIKVESMSEEGSDSKEIRGITANRSGVKLLLDIVTRMKVLPCEFKYAVDKILEK